MKYSNTFIISLLILIKAINATNCWEFVQSFSTRQKVYELDYSPDGSVIITAEEDYGLNLYKTSDYTFVNSKS